MHHNDNYIDGDNLMILITLETSRTFHFTKTQQVRIQKSHDGNEHNDVEQDKSSTNNRARQRRKTQMININIKKQA